MSIEPDTIFWKVEDYNQTKFRAVPTTVLFDKEGQYLRRCTYKQLKEIEARWPEESVDSGLYIETIYVLEKVK